MESLLYVALVLLGVSSLGQFKPAENGGAAFSQIVTHYMGNFGVLITGVIVTLAVFTTAMGLFVSFAQDLNRVFPKVSYLWWLRVIAFGSFVTANAGLTNIVKWTVPVLMLLYPYALALIALSLLSPWIKQSPTIYRAVMGFVTLPAFLDAFASSPVAGWAPMADLVASYHQHLPLAADGFGWVLPALLGGLVGLTWQRAQ
ncbi:Branched-chain amino acid transport system 2 carrier protein [Convivina intestini]|nr:Branched-chain amino acid transport system 2 carrier protein [Convivina intestini]